MRTVSLLRACFAAGTAVLSMCLLTLTASAETPASAGDSGSSNAGVVSMASLAKSGQPANVFRTAQFVPATAAGVFCPASCTDNCVDNGCNNCTSHACNCRTCRKQRRCGAPASCQSCQSCQSGQACRNGACQNCRNGANCDQCDDGNFLTRLCSRSCDRLFGWMVPSGCCGQGCPPLGKYKMNYAVNPGYAHPADNAAYGAQGYGVPITVPLAPNVRQSYNYSSGIPASRITPVGHYIPGHTATRLPCQTW